MNNDEYSIAWIGTSIGVKSTDIDSIQKGSHRLVRSAQQQGLSCHCDSFDIDEDGNPQYFLMIGKNIGMLGYKEGITFSKIGLKKIEHCFEEIKPRLQAMGISDPPQLYFLFHVNYD